MIDLKHIKENPDEIKEMLTKRGFEADVEELIKLDNKRLETLHKVEDLRAERNIAAKEKNIERGKEIKKELQVLEPDLKKLDDEVTELHKQIPNLLHPDVPVGPDESANKEIRRWGEIKELAFKAKDHEELGTALDIIDIEKAAQISGSGFYFLKKGGALLEFALTRFVLDILGKEGFVPMITPELVRTEYAEGTGYLPKREEPDIYKLEDDDLFLIATAEIPLGAYHAGDILSEKDLPIKYSGFSSCFRREAGSYGKHKKGIFRVHQFDKLEMFTLTTPDNSMDTFHYMIGLSETILQRLQIPYRVVNIASGDMNGPGYIKYDLEYYSPVDGEYRELTSGTNTTDYQARRLGIRYRDEEAGENRYVHTLNNTAFAFSRGLIAILENYQNEDGSITVPEALKPYTGFETITTSD